MRAWIMVLLAAAAGPCIAAEAYRWVDERGVVNYGEKPPEERRATPVDTRPIGTIETGGQYDPRPAAGPRRQAEPQPPQVVIVPPPAPALPSVRGMEFDTYIRLQRGMTEGELLVRAGRPDHETVDNLFDYDRTLYYFPTVANPFTTVVRLRSGTIFSIDRIKRF
ncbi:MAG TPA: DUF4124 domain-containing protein [Burkholderiales bacterium]|nr:DUF4124 domain-containing protein [Burkholderiales bacterium]